MRLLRWSLLLALLLSLAAADAPPARLRPARGLHPLAALADSLRSAGQGSLRVDPKFAQTQVYLDGAAYTGPELLTALLAATGLELRVTGGELLLTAPKQTAGAEERSLEANATTALGGQKRARASQAWALPWPDPGSPVALDYAKLTERQRGTVDRLLQSQRATHVDVGAGVPTRVELRPACRLGLTRAAASK